MGDVGAHNVLLPVYSIDPGPEDSFRAIDIVGTCSSIGSCYLITAGHVVEALGDAARGAVRVVDPRTMTPHGLRIVDHEVLAHDLGLLHVEIPDEDAKGWVKEPPWLSSQLDLLAPVASMGFPYGMQHDAQGSTSLLRAFSGHVVSGRRYLPPGMKPPAFDAYELSFAVPRGLSGAPLLDYRTADGTTAVSGIVIGNGRESMLVHTQTEKDSATKETVVVERWESLQLGIAVQASCVLSTRSTLLGRTIGEHLEERRLVLDRRR